MEFLGVFMAVQVGRSVAMTSPVKTGRGEKTWSTCRDGQGRSVLFDFEYGEWWKADSLRRIHHPIVITFDGKSEATGPSDYRQFLWRPAHRSRWSVILFYFYFIFSGLINEEVEKKNFLDPPYSFLFFCLFVFFLLLGTDAVSEGVARRVATHYGIVALLMLPIRNNVDRVSPCYCWCYVISLFSFAPAEWRREIATPFFFLLILSAFVFIYFFELLLGYSGDFWRLAGSALSLWRNHFASSFASRFITCALLPGRAACPFHVEIHRNCWHVLQGEATTQDERIPYPRSFSGYSFQRRAGRHVSASSTYIYAVIIPGKKIK